MSEFETRFAEVSPVILDQFKLVDKEKLVELLKSNTLFDLCNIKYGMKILTP